MTFLLDTNIVIALLKKDPAIQDQLAGNTIFLCSIVLGELDYGARKSARSKENLADIERFSPTIQFWIAPDKVRSITAQSSKHWEPKGF